MEKITEKNLACIYKITNNINQKFYVGSTKDFRTRMRYHLQINRSGCKTLTKAFEKYGIENFKWEVLEIINISHLSVLEIQQKLRIREQYYLDTLLFAQEYINKVNKKFLEIGYNINPLSNSRAFCKETSVIHKQTKVIAYTSSGSLYKIYDSIKEASLDTGDSRSCICRCCIYRGGLSIRNKSAKSKARKYIYRYYTENYSDFILIENLVKKNNKGFLKGKTWKIINNKQVWDLR